MRKLFRNIFLLLIITFFCLGVAYAASSTDEAVLGNDRWSVNSSGDLIPNTTNTYDIGSATYYPAEICLGGVCKTSWGSVVSPMTDATGYVNPTDAGAYLRLYDAGYIRLGDATNAGDYYVLFTGDSDAWYAGQYDTTNDFEIGYGSTIGTTPRLSIVDSSTVTNVVIGDAAQYDMQITFDGNAQDYAIGLDDTTDDLVICLGSALGTTNALSIDEDLAISTYGDITMTGTTPTLTIGDAGQEDTKVVFDGNAQDYYVGLDDTDDSLNIGLGSTLGTTPAINIASSLALTTYADITMTGTTPTLTVGDAGNEDNMVVFDGVVDFAVGVDATAGVFEIDNGADLDQTCAISIDANEDIIFPSGNVNIVDDKNLVFGTDSNWAIQYDEGVDDQLIFLTAGTAATATTDPLFEIIVGATPTADQQVFGVSKGTQASNTALLVLDEDGDMVVTGATTSTGVFTASSTSTLEGAVTVSGGAVTVTGTTPIITVGDAGNEDNTLLFDGQTTHDFYIATDNADDSLIMGYGSTVGTDSRLTIQDNATETRIELGDAAEEDTVVVLDGNAQDFYIALDDSADSLLIGKGATVATTPAITISATPTVTITPATIITGTLTANSAIIAGYEMVTTSGADPGVGAASITTLFTDITSTSAGSAADAVSLAAGAAGQVKVIQLAVDGETTGTSITANYFGATAAALMEDVGDVLILISDGTEWHIILNTGCTLS